MYQQKEPFLQITTLITLFVCFNLCACLQSKLSRSTLFVTDSNANRIAEDNEGKESGKEKSNRYLLERPWEMEGQKAIPDWKFFKDFDWLEDQDKQEFYKPENESIEYQEVG